uniref:Uncharacterized protein n=1 Tax=Tetradesmus obliquus TaxID=3088 RepID=A0A383VEV1_TETOB|eukprot:jgi/Sobl393_1/16240/SZX64047.1
MWAAGSLQQMRGCKIAATGHGLRHVGHLSQQVPCSPLHGCSRISSRPGAPKPKRGSRLIMYTGLESFLGLSALLKPEVAAVFSAVLAVGSVGLNYYGNLMTESKRVELQKELDREKQAEAVLQELASIIARYRGPLLESSVDLEQRLWHLATMTGEWYKAEDVLCGEEIAYTLFTLAQFLGFLEVVRREGPRERSFLAAGNPQGSDTLATLVEGFRFVLCASPATLQGWLDEPGELRDHPGARQRKPYQPVKGKRKAMTAGLKDGSGACVVPLRVSRGSQRAIGSQMGCTPLGSERHYTHSYSTFLGKLQTEPEFAAWLQPIEADLAALLTGPSWMGEPAARTHRWTRVLLLQQLLVDAIDLLDPDYVRVPANRRIRLSPIAYAPLPNVQQYTAALTLLSGPMDATRFGAGLGGLVEPKDGEHFAALQNLLHPERVLQAANQVRSTRAAQGNGNGGTGSTQSAQRSPSSSANVSPTSTVAVDDEVGAAAAAAASGAAATPPADSIMPAFKLPSVGATGVQLLKAISGQKPPAEPQLQQGSGSLHDLGGTPVTSDAVRGVPQPANGTAKSSSGKST